MGETTLITPQDAHYARVVQSLHSGWYPHDSQIPVIQAIFRDGIRIVFIRAGRKFGKTELCTYILWRFGLCKSHAQMYYIGPIYKQVKEIVWANKRIQGFSDDGRIVFPQEWIKRVDVQDTRVTLINDSFIKVDGSDNYDIHRGINPDVYVFDEFAQFHPEFIRATWPNLAAKNALIVFIGTPPEEPWTVLPNGKKLDHQYVEYQKMVERMMKRQEGFYMHAPSHVNPYLPKGWLEREQRRLQELGEEWVYNREYLAQYIVGGHNYIFPMYKPLDENQVPFNEKVPGQPGYEESFSTHQVPHEFLAEAIKRDKHHLKYFVFADPGSSTCFAVLFIAFDPFNSRFYILDEIYETNPDKTSTGQIWRRIQEKISKLTGGWMPWPRWTRVYDSAAKWFAVEMQSQFGVGWTPTDKREGDKEEGISLFKDVLRANKCLISTNCPMTSWEIQNYKTDESGRIKDDNEHAVDLIRYFLKRVRYAFKDLVKAEQPLLVDRPRVYTVGRDIKEAKEENDWTARILSAY